MDRLAVKIVDAMRDDRDADVYNLIEKGVSENPMKLAWALARLAAAGDDLVRKPRDDGTNATDSMDSCQANP